MKHTKECLNVAGDHAETCKCQPKHTPTPWKSTQEPGLLAIRNDIGYPIAEIGSLSDVAKADAAFIVRAVNCHEDLLKELRRVTEDMNTLVDNEQYWNRAQRYEVIFAIQSNVAEAIRKAEASDVPSSGEGR